MENKNGERKERKDGISRRYDAGSIHSGQLAISDPMEQSVSPESQTKPVKTRFTVLIGETDSAVEGTFPSLFPLTPRGTFLQNAEQIDCSDSTADVKGPYNF